MVHFLFHRVVLIGLLLLLGVNPQQHECITLEGGCDQGRAYEFAVRAAIGRFDGGLLYGDDGEPVIFSTYLLDGTLAQISYTCREGSIPPPLYGFVIQSQ